MTDRRRSSPRSGKFSSTHSYFSTTTMKAGAAKNNTISHSKTVAFEIPSSLQENLTKAIHGAFEVAVEIAVLEVTKLITVAAGDMYERIEQENETLKEELQKAQCIIDSVCSKAGSITPQNGQLLRDNVASTTTSAAHSVYKCHQDRTGTRSVDQSVSSEHHQNEEAGQYFTSHDDAVSDAHEESKKWTNITVEDKQSSSHMVHNLNPGTSPEISLDFGDVKVERTTELCMSDEADSPSVVSFPDNTAPQLVKVKEEKSEETLIASDSLVNSFKEDAISQLQSEILQEWTPGVSDFEPEEQNVSQIHGHPSNVNFSLDSSLESSSSLNVNFPVHVTDQTSPQDPTLHIYGGHVRGNQGNSKSNLHTCKLCGLNFPLPSLLRRHYGQCQQKLSQRIVMPTVGGKRTKLQLYPPGCSPFRCSECNREFNRLENLKTHLRIHTGERPYKCSVCSTAFRHSGALTRHFRIHTGEKPYVCGLCGKSFRNCGGLKFHQRTHNKQL